MPHQQEQHRGIEVQAQGATHIPQVYVVGVFLVIFLSQVGINFLHAVRAVRRRQRGLHTQPLNALPQRDRSLGRGSNGAVENNRTPPQENTGSYVEGRHVRANASGSE